MNLFTISSLYIQRQKQIESEKVEKDILGKY